MFKIERKGDLFNILKLFGRSCQLLKFCEECGELIRACNRHEVSADIEKDNLTEEIADVYVMLHQIQIMYELDHKEIEKIYNGKIDRVIQRYF